MSVKDKVAKGGQAVMNAGHKAFSTVTADRRSELEQDLPKERPDVYQAQDLLPQTYRLPDGISSLEDRAAQTQSEQDRLIERVENVAFRHHYYHAQANYEPAFPLVYAERGEACQIKRNPYVQAVRGIVLRRFVVTNEELQTEKMNNILSSMASLGSTLALVIHRSPIDSTLSLLTSTTRSDLHASGYSLEERANQTLETLNNVLCGNFPGTETITLPNGSQPQTFAELKEIFPNFDSNQEPTDIRGWLRNFRIKGKNCGFDYSTDALLDEVFYRDNRKAVAAVTGIPSMKSKEGKFVAQGIEKLIDGIVPRSKDESYTLLLLATPLSPQQVAQQRNGYEQLASQLSPLQGFQFSVTATHGNSASATVSETLSRQISEATTLSAGVGAHAGASANASASTSISKGTNASTSEGENWSHSDSSSKSKTMSGNFKIASYSRTKTTGTSDSKGRNTSESHGTSNSMSAGAQASAGASAGISAHLDMTENLSGGRSYCWNSSAAQSLESSFSQGETRTYTSEPVMRVVERLHQEIRRLEASESSGMWRFAGYAIAGNFAMAQRVASVYQGMIQGEGSEVERSSVNIWTDRDRGFNAIIASLLNFEHPQFHRKNEESTLPSDMYCATELTSSELALAMALPQKAVPGLPVVTCAAFGRSVQTMDGRQESESDALYLGNLYHMMQEEKQLPVSLDKLSLTAHTFVTGSTGSGKSNAIYTLLLEAQKDNIPFLVIEPAKGEYKDALGTLDGVRVLGTNNKFAPLLRLNPFSFPNTIHVLEHIDRITEIFNACWPMYAAMPAILKDTFVRAYVQTGWDVQSSESEYETPCYPTFQDVLDLLPIVIKESSYSADTTSDYVGALVTRVRSLTTGLNGLIFAEDELDFSEVFNQSTVIDLSRIASNETKSLIMGLLVIKLQELRMHEAETQRNLTTNSPIHNRTLRHLTVLEEAHNLLRLTSTAQNQESANLQGKSVELIANSIAEMRTYGEGFIIADQAPGLLDPVVIRNTNTKILLRLPDATDREIVGRAAALDKKQCDELAKLPRGVAAVYQSDWLEAVLCKIKRADIDDTKVYVYDNDQTLSTPVQEMIARTVLGTAFEATDDDWLKMCEWCEKHVGACAQRIIVQLRRGQSISDGEKEKVLYDVFHGKEIGERIRKAITERGGSSLILQSVRRHLPLRASIDSAQLSQQICDLVFSLYCEFLRQEADQPEKVERLKDDYDKLQGGNFHGTW